MSALPAPDSWLYRIIRFDRFVEMLETDQWFFAHPSAWEDPYETLIKNSRSNALFAQCWCRKGVSDAMWRIYSQDNLGIRIRTTKQQLKLALLREATARGFGARIASVKYLNELQYVARTEVIKYNLKQAPTFARSCAHLFLKRLAFEHEAETRVVVFDPNDQNGAPRRSIKVKLNTRQLIDSVLVDPRAPEPFVDAYRMLLKEKLKFPGSVEKSQLYRSGEVREA
jgi:hypothetical protein